MGYYRLIIILSLNQWVTSKPICYRLIPSFYPGGGSKTIQKLNQGTAAHVRAPDLKPSLLYPTLLLALLNQGIMSGSYNQSLNQGHTAPTAIAALAAEAQARGATEEAFH